LVQVNRFLPLINYKRNIENLSKTDLYGRQLVFYVKNSQGGKVPVEYAQEIVEMSEDNGELFVEIVFLEMGG